MAKPQIIYGYHSVLAALQNQPQNVLVLYCEDKADAARYKQALALAQENDITPQLLSRAKLDKLVANTHHQGIAAQIKTSEPMSAKQLLAWLGETDKKPLLLILEGIQDPHNLGACLRSALALGVDFVIVPKMHSAPITPTVSKVSCGADQLLPVIPVTNLVRFIEDLKQQGVWVIGTQAGAPQLLSQVDLTRSVALVMGTEGKGVKRLTLESCDEIAAIPLVGNIASLNVSVATGICLYECLRQRTF